MQRSLIAVLMLAAVACGSDRAGGTAPGPKSPIGSYALVSMDGKPMPAGESALGPPYFVRGALTLNAGGTYTENTTDSTSTQVTSTVSESGTWLANVAGDSIQFTTSTANRQSGPSSFDGAVVTRLAYGHLFAFKRQ